MENVCNFFAWLSQERAAPLHLTAVEQSELDRLVDAPQENFAFLSRICALLQGDALVRERQSFIELMAALRYGYDMPNLATRLEQVAFDFGGLLSPDEVQVQRAVAEKSRSVVH